MGPIQTITDTRGRTYLLDFFEARDQVDWRVKYQGKEIGKIVCTFDRNDMIGQDFEVEKHFRRARLGTSLLNLAIAYAKRKGLQHIFGSVVTKDLSDTPDLLKFYEKRGFKRVSGYPGSLANAVVCLSMDLD